MSVYVRWEIEDNEGTNPTNTPGWFDFRLECEVENSDFEYAYAPGDDHVSLPNVATEIVRVTCRRVHLSDETEVRTPTEDEANSLSMWFYGWVATRPDEMTRIRQQAIEYAYPEPDYDESEY